MINYSIIVPCYYSSGFVGRLLDTIPDSSDIEVILIDDSFDDTEHTKLKKVADAYDIRLLKNTDSKGVSGARNTGLEHATGVWGIFADSDDMFITNAFVNMLKEHQRLSVDQIVFRVNSKNIETDKDSGRADALGYYADKYINTYPGVAVAILQTVVYTTLFRIDTIKDNNIKFQKYRMGEDALFMAEMSKYVTSSRIDNSTVYTIVENSSSVTSNLDINLFEDWITTSAKRNEIYKTVLSRQEFQIVKQTRFVILLKALKQLGLRGALRINHLANEAHLPFAKKDDFLYALTVLLRRVR